MTETLQQHGDTLGVARVSAALGVPRASAYRWRKPPALPRERDGARVVRTPSPRALSQTAQDQVLAYLRDPRFVDRAPAQVHATLLDEGTYVCSVRTLYRLLASAHEVRARRRQRTHRPVAVPRLVATQPNQVWTWDVTDLKGPVKGERYKLYVVLDLFSRYVVAWMLARQESATLAQRLIRTACARQGIVRDQLTTHSDRGSIQIAKDLHDLYQALGIVRSLSRPRVSNDNPYSESLFKTTKYAPRIPTASTATRTPKCGVVPSSTTTTTSTNTKALLGSRPRRCTTDRPPPSSPSANKQWTARISSTPSVL